MGHLAGKLRTVVGEDAWRDRQLLIEQAWRAIGNWAADLASRAGGIRVYQDGLPVCGSEIRIVRELAEKGSPNHRILGSLVDAGATLVGTEDPTLLLEEYERVMAAAKQQQESGVEPDPAAGRALLDRRDAFIASRIDETLPPGGEGVLFIGMLHDVAGKLSADVKTKYPFGEPRAAA